MSTPTDPLYSQQWHLREIGNLQKIWDDYTGRGVHVAVYDDGLQFTHPDLAANYDATRHFSFDGTTYAPVPLTKLSAHGTACAGLIAAVANNGVGGTGVAHGATLTGIDYLNTLQYAYDWDGQTSSPLYDATMRWAAGFDIMSNSWGTDPTYDERLNLNNPGYSSAVDAAHFEWVSVNGRNGLGTIVVKAAGNDTLNANGDGTNASRHTITVAATEKNGFAANYSNFGSSILITAPAASVTTDLVGERGFNRTGTGDGDPLAQIDYMSTFNGTSAATPVVAGVVALMLEANPGLGWRDVQGILAMSASHTGSAPGAGPSATEVGSWLNMGGTQWNGGGALYHLSYGFGMVDAYAAVRMAEVWSRLHDAPRTSGNEQHITAERLGYGRIRDSDGNEATPEARLRFKVSDDIEIDSVQLTLRIQHGYAEDLRIMLRGPQGQLMTLFDREGGATLFDDGLTWTFAAEGFRGLSSQGTWTLEVHDLDPRVGGWLFDPRLDFYGSANSVDDVHHFTDDFQMLRSLDADRRVIQDQNGGIDWLNFAAMTGNLAVKMVVGGAVKLNGTVLATLGGTFERLQAGDGRDALAGNALGNVIYGGRGNDRINGGKGNDRLWGEAGNDTLTGGAGADELTGGAGQDVFVFAPGFGRDRITDWSDAQDRLHLDGTIWGGGLTVGQMLAKHGSVVAGSVVLQFGAAQTITLQGVTDLGALHDNITII